MADPKRPPSETYSDEETARRAEAVIKRMLNTPPQPRRAKQEKAKDKPARKARSKSPS